MKLIDINEKGVLLNLKVNQRILSLDLNYDEFYSDAIEKNDGYEWKQMFISKLLEVKKTDEDIILLVRKDIHNRVSKYLGVWKPLEKDNLFFEKKEDIVIDNTIYGIANLTNNEYNSLFSNLNGPFVVGKYNDVKNIYFSSALSNDELTVTLLNRGYKILRFISLGPDGKILEIIEKDID